MSDIKCDIILPVCDQFKFTKDCIESIIANTDTSYRLIVINNGTNTRTQGYLDSLKSRLGDNIRVIRNNTNVGWVKALNQGIDISNAPYICFQNDDTVVTWGWLRKMIRILEENRTIGIVNPAWEGRPSHVSIEEYGGRLEKINKGRFVETDWARGFSVVLKRQVVERIGGVDEVYGLAYFDDVDFSVRAVNAGFLVALALDTYVYHHRNVTFFEVLKGKKWNELHEKNKVIYYKKFGKPLRMVVILDKDCCRGESLRRVRDAVFYLTRKQHHIEIWSPSGIAEEFQHTNIRFRHYPGGFLMRLFAFLDIYSNARKKAEKRYNAIFAFDRFFENLRYNGNLFKGTAVYHNDGKGDFCEFIRQKSDELKEGTKSLFR